MYIVGRCECGSKGKYSVCHRLISLNREWSIWEVDVLEEYVVAYFFSYPFIAYLAHCCYSIRLFGYVCRSVGMWCIRHYNAQASHSIQEEWKKKAQKTIHTRNEEEKIRKMRAKGILRACTYGHCCCCCCYFSILFRSRYRIGCSLYGATVIALECVDIDTMRDPSTCIDVVVVAFRSASFRNVRDVPSSTLQSRRKATTTHTHSKRRWCCQIVFFYFSFCFSSSWWFFTLSFFFGLNKIVCDQLPLVAFFYANKKIRCRIYHLFTSKQYLKPRGDNCCWCCHGGCHRHFIPWVNVLSLREKIV